MFFQMNITLIKKENYYSPFFFFKNLYSFRIKILNLTHREASVADNVAGHFVPYPDY
jgi:hypothetical protein